MIIRNSFRSVLSSFHRITASRQLLAITAILLGFNACYNEPELLGGNLIPSEDKGSVQITDTFKVAAYTIKTDTLITSNVFNNDGSLSYAGSSEIVLGNYNDNIFGGIKSNFYTRIYQANTKDTLAKVIIANRPIADSLILMLKLNKTWGDKNTAINVKVFRLTSRIDSSKLFNGLVNPGLSYNPVQVNETTVYRGEEYLKIKFTKAFRDIIMNADTSVLSSHNSFMQLIYGLYFTADSLTGDEKGVLYSFDLSASLFSMYYPKANPLYRQPSYNLNFGYKLFNYFQHNYDKAKIPMKLFSEINDNTPQDTVFGVEGFGGVRGLFKLKGVKEWRKLMPIAIHRAELRFDIQDNIGELPTDSIMKPLYFYSYRSYSPETNAVTEYKLFAKYNYSRYIKAKSYYSIDVTFQLQDLLKGKINRDYIIVEPYNVRNTSDKSAPRDNYMKGLYRTGNNSKPIKLIVTYSKL